MADEETKSEAVNSESEKVSKEEKLYDGNAAEVSTKAEPKEEEAKGEESKEEPKSESKEGEPKEETKEEPAKDSEEKKDSESKEEEVKYELEQAEESLLEDGAIDRVKVFAKEQKLSNEQAQAVLDREEGLKITEQKALMAKGDAWRKESLADPEIGGTEEKLKETCELAKRGMEGFFKQEIIDWIGSSRLGDKADVLMGFANIGRMIGDDKLVMGKVGTTPRPKTREEKLYDNPTSQPLTN